MLVMRRGKLGSSKHQGPSSREAPISKLQFCTQLTAGGRGHFVGRVPSRGGRLWPMCTVRAYNLQLSTFNLKPPLGDYSAWGGTGAPGDQERYLAVASARERTCSFS